MKTVALRFSDNLAPEKGMIYYHEEVINRINYVWMGKLGIPISQKSADIIMNNESPKILLIQSGKSKRYWAYVEKIGWEIPDYEEFPEYYHKEASKFKSWFKIHRIEEAESNILSKCTVVSSGKILAEASKHSMSPFFVINIEE